MGSYLVSSDRTIVSELQISIDSEVDCVVSSLTSVRDLWISYEDYNPFQLTLYVPAKDAAGAPKQWAASLDPTER